MFFCISGSCLLFGWMLFLAESVSSLWNVFNSKNTLQCLNSLLAASCMYSWASTFSTTGKSKGERCKSARTLFFIKYDVMRYVIGALQWKLPRAPLSFNPALTARLVSYTCSSYSLSRQNHFNFFGLTNKTQSWRLHNVHICFVTSKCSIWNFNF